MKNDVCWCKKLLDTLKFFFINFSEKKKSQKPPASRKSKKKIVAKSFCKHGKLTQWSIQKYELYHLVEQGPLQHLRWSFLWQSYNVPNSSILDIAGDPRSKTSAEYFSMAASTLVPSAFFLIAYDDSNESEISNASKKQRCKLEISNSGF